MFSRFFSRIAGRRCGSCGSTSLLHRRPARRLAAAAGQAVDALEGRVLLSTFYVDASAPGPTYDGTSWATAYTDLQLALSASTSGDEIRIADGTYKPTSTTDRAISFALCDGVAIRGGYAGYGVADPDGRDITLYPTVLSGDIGTAGNNADNSYHVLTASAVGPLTVLDGVAVTGGNANGSVLYRYGGGLYATGASLTLTNCTFWGNSAITSGGGMYNTSSSPTLVNCTFSGNSASSGNSYNSYGGGMYNGSSSSPTLTNCIFSGNSANYGGAMYNSSSSPTLANCTISGNSASSSGGGIYSAYSSLKLTNCIVWGNANEAIYDRSSASAPVITCSDIQGGYAGVDNIDADPLFVRSPWTGPDGVFGSADDDLGDLRLRAGSPVLDIGSNTAVSGISTDLAGNARIQNGTVDLGACEGTTAAPAPKTLYVDAAAGGANTGHSWANAFTSLQSALAAAGDGDTIRIADGTYRPTSTTDRTIGFALRNAVALYGGHAGYGAADPDARDIALYPTVLSGDIGTVGTKTDNSYHVLTASGVGSLTILDGIIVTGGNADSSASSGSNGDGGGLYATGSSPTLTNCTFSGNSAGSGGGMYNSSSSPTLTNCIFRGNWASRYGGGMYNQESSSPTLTNCTFSGNGGGMYNYISSSPTLVNCTFTGNFRGMDNIYSSSPTLVNCTFSGHSASGMYNEYASSPTLTNCIVWGNAMVAISNSPATPLTKPSTPVITYSDIQGGYAGTGNINADPLFVRSPWTGPDGVFGTADDDPGDLHLQPSSPALNAGFNAAIAGVSTDLAGNARIQNGTVDLGAYEGATTLPTPRIFYVDHAATGGNSGVSWADAFTSLQSALAVAANGDTIRMADGTYKPTSGTDRTLGFALRDGVAIHGGYAGYGAPNPDARDTALYSTILSADIGTAGSNTDNSYHVLTAIVVGPSTLLDGVTVTGGNANGSGTNQPYGGGLYAASASPTLVNCTFSGNSANSGGGMYNTYSSSPTLVNCTFSGNSASNRGGGMCNYLSSSPTLANCTFSGNSASTYGGGMHNTYSSSPTLVNCTLSGNSAGTCGGGIYNASSSSPTLVNCTFSGNATSSTLGYGGGIYNASSSSPKLTNCTLSGNSANSGGGMYNSYSSPTLTNCTFSGNSASYGGGMYNDSVSSPLLINCTFSGNSASYGGGMYNYSSSPTLTNCIVWGNTAITGPQVHRSGGTLMVTYSDIQGGYIGTGNINADPLFVRNPSPGPDGLWNGVDDDYGDLRLQPGSPCIDRGNNNAPGLSGIVTDLAGQSRFVDNAFTPDAGVGTPPIVDMGAYEVQSWCPLWLDPADLATWDAGSNSLDIGDSVLVVAADDSNRSERLAAIRQFIASARGGGAGIVSSAAAENRGVIVALDEEGNILVRLALIGDVTLDDQLDGDDYFAMDMAFLAAGSFQPAADLNVDGAIDSRDYLLLDLGFLRSATAGVQPAAALPAVQAAPQPAAPPFSTRSISDELLVEEGSVLL